MRTRQLVHRTRRLVPLRMLAAGTPGIPPPVWRPLGAGVGVEPAPSTGPVRPPHLDGAFHAYGATRDAGDPALWWDPDDGQLFLFHLHGFQDLARFACSEPDGRGVEFWHAVIGSWLRDCGSPALPAWHPYPLSGRTIAWCAALSGAPWLDALREPMLATLWRGLHVLRRSIEHDIGGNHVLRNATALAIGGACFEDPTIRAAGLRLLRSELSRQVLDDGGHEERSPSYHRLVLADLEDVATVLSREGPGVPGWLADTIERMRYWLHAVAGPDGLVPPLNDGWDGPPVAPPAERPAIDRLLPSGYLALRAGGAQAVLDVGPLAPAHLPAHAHADALSLVLWADRRPMLVDPGSGSYAGPERDAFRSTAAHNTVQVDGQDQCELWGTFRAARMPRVRLEAVEERGDGVLLVRASHDGYRRLADPVVHERTFVWLGEDGIVVLDRLLCGRPHEVAARLHFAEGVGDPVRDDLPGGLRLAALGVSGQPVAVTGRRSPYIGHTSPIPVVEMRSRVSPGERLGWGLTRPGVEVLLEGARLRLALPGSRELEIELPSD